MLREDILEPRLETFENDSDTEKEPIESNGNQVEEDDSCMINEINGPHIGDSIEVY